MEPQEPMQETDQVTALLLVVLPAAAAVKVCVPPAFSDIVPGLTAEIVIGTRLTVAVEVTVGYALAVAVTVTVFEAVTLAGAV